MPGIILRFRVNACLTDTVHNLQGDNYKLINMLGLCKPTNTGTFGDDKPNWDPEGYCWLHGFYVRLDHNIGNCDSPRPGHKKKVNR